MEFKEISIITFQNINYRLHYQLIIKTIKFLLFNNSINSSLVLDYRKKVEISNRIEQQVFEEQYNNNC